MPFQTNLGSHEKLCGRSHPPSQTTGHLASSDAGLPGPSGRSSVIWVAGSVATKLLIVALLFAAPLVSYSQKMSDKPQLKVKHIASDFAVSDLDNAAWESSFQANLGGYWDGTEASPGRRANATLLWSDTALYVRFVANQTEPLVVAEKPDLSKKAMNLWDRDVVEIFVAPDKKEPRKYFEFEAAPTGEWLDVGLDSTSGKRVSDWNYTSSMEAAAKIEKDRVVIAMKIPWKAFGRTPKAGDVWLGNLLRCVGKDPDRGYLAWSPTMTKTPNFHVPERFGEFHFAK